MSVFQASRLGQLCIMNFDMWFLFRLCRPYCRGLFWTSRCHTCFISLFGWLFYPIVSRGSLFCVHRHCPLVIQNNPKVLKLYLSPHFSITKIKQEALNLILSRLSLTRCRFPFLKLKQQSGDIRRPNITSVLRLI